MIPEGDTELKQEVGAIIGAIGASGQPMNGTAAYAWANGFNNLITVSGGVILDAVWGTSGYVSRSLDDQPGIRLEIKPIEGLNLGLGLNIPKYNVKPELADAFKDGLYFGAKYAHPAFIVNVAGRLTYGEVGEEKEEKSGFEALFGVKIPLNPLTIDIDGWFATEDTQYSTNDFFSYHIIEGQGGKYLPGFRVAPRVTYSQDAITAYLVADIRAGTPDTSVAQINTEAAGDARVEIRAQGAYKISDTWQPFLRIGVENVAAIEYGPLYVRFGNTFKVAPNATISLYDQINNIGGSEDAGTDHIANRVYVGFNYTF